MTRPDPLQGPPGLSSIKAVALDAFGTIVYIADPRKPYRRLLEIGERGGRPILPSDPATIMSMRGDLLAAADTLGIALTRQQQLKLLDDVEAEATSVIVFPETLAVLEELRAAGKRLVVVSNLSQPYGDRLKQIIGPAVDAYVLSYEVGAVKPDPRIYQAATEACGCAPESILFVGDTPMADLDGPRSAGMQARLIDRAGRYASMAPIESLLRLSAHC